MIPPSIQAVQACIGLPNVEAVLFNCASPDAVTAAVEIAASEGCSGTDKKSSPPWPSSGTGV